MNRFIITTCALFIIAVSASAQKFALLDMEYILKNQWHKPQYRC